MEKYDAIIIGSGLGGLECGVILGMEGKRVLVLEKNKQVGGNLQIFSRNKRIFDTGVHYVGGLEKGQNLHTYFSYLGIMVDLKIRRMKREAYDLVSFEGDPISYPYGQGYEQFVEGLSAIFPEERAGIEKFTNEVRQVCKSFPLYNVESMEDPMQYLNRLNINAKDFIASCTTNPKLQKVLGGTSPLFAGEGDKTPFYVLALVINSYIESSWKFVDGGSQIAKALVKQLRKYDGHLIKHADVTKVLFDDKMATGVQTADGREFYADMIISNVHPAVTLEMIEPGKLKRAYRKRVTGLDNSAAAFILYLVMKEGTTPILDSNIYHYFDHEVWDNVNYKEEDWPPSIAMFSSISSKSETHTDALIAMAYMKMSEVEQWADTFNTVSEGDDRGAEYEAFKTQKAEQLLDAIEKKIPNIREHLECYYTSTPLTYRDYINTPNGSMYGISKDAEDPMRTFISAKTKIPNLYLTGQNLNMHGVLGVTIGAFTTCGEIFGQAYLVDKIKASVQESVSNA